MHIGNHYMVTLASFCNSLRPPFRASVRELRLRGTALLALLLGGLFLSGCTSGLATLGASKTTEPGTLAASTNTVAFGSIPVGQSASTNITVVNQGSAPVVISQMSVSGQSFGVTGQSQLPASISPSSTFTITISFNPSATGAASGQLTVTSNASGSNSLQVGLSGMGAAAAKTIALTSLSCTSNSITGSTADNCTVELSAPAGSSGLVVNLASNNSVVTVPTSVTVAAGATSANFVATANAVNTGQTVTLTADANNITEEFSGQ
jgi:hypothetical protein